MSEPIELTEAEVAARLYANMAAIADRLNDLLPDAVREAGLRITWAPGVTLPPIAPDGILTYDMVLPAWPGPDPGLWTPMRDIIRRSGRCYRLGSGAMVHIKPDCRC